jgi:hypothetical protein
MWLAETSVYLFRNANEVCFSAAVVISILFYLQYKKYEEEAEREEMIESFLSN